MPRVKGGRKSAGTKGKGGLQRAKRRRARLKAAELKVLADFLDAHARPGGGLGIVGAHGLMTAVAIGPGAVPEERWMARILGRRPESQAGFLNRGHEEGIKGLISRLFQEISGRLVRKGGDGIVPMLSAAAKADRHEEPELRAGLMEWCSGFLDGVFLDVHGWSRLTEDDLHGHLMEEILTCGTHAERERFLALDLTELRDIEERLCRNLAAIHAFWEARRQKGLVGS